MTIYLAQKTQILSLITKEVIVLLKYTDFANVFLNKLAKVLLEKTDINKHTIKLLNNKQLFCRLIYGLGLVKLKTLKIYIKIKLSNSFI